MNSSPQPDPQGDRLTAAASLRQLVGGIVSILVFAALALHQWNEKKTFWAILYAVAGVAQILSLPALLAQYRIVKQGGVILLPQPAPDANPPSRLALAFFVLVVTVLTALVAGMGFVSFLLLRDNPDWQTWTIAGAINAALWLYVAHCWRRILFPKPQSVPTIEYDEPQEGVWPPPPPPPF